MWTLLFIAMFIVGSAALYVRLTPKKGIDTAHKLLALDNPNIREIEACISRLNMIEQRDLKDECIDLAKKLRKKADMIKTKTVSNVH
jgi:hypothetical protein